MDNKYKVSAIEEAKNLKDKISEIATLIASDAYYAFSKEDRYLLTIQYSQMKDYHVTLSKRIARL